MWGTSVVVSTIKIKFKKLTGKMVLQKGDRQKKRGIMLGETTPGSRHAKTKSTVRESLAYCSIRFYTILIHKTSVLGEAKSSHSLCGETYRKGQMEITLYLRVPTQLSRTALANLLSYSLELLFQNFPLLKTLYQPILSLSTNELSSSERNIEATR